MNERPFLTVRSPRARRPFAHWSLVILIAVAFALRLFFLDTQPIWWDEAISIHLATSPLADLLADRAAHVHPPLYFLLLKAWVALAGTTAFSVRFLSAWFNTLLIPATCAFGRRWFDRRTGLVASVLVTLSPLYVVYSQEARVYAALPLLYLAMLALIERLRGEDYPATRRQWLLLALVEAVGLHLHYVFLIAVAYANGLLLLGPVRKQGVWTRWLGSLALVGLLSLPWIAAVAFSWPSVVADAGVDAPFVEPAPLDYFARLLWTFQWSGLTGAPGYPPIQWTALALAASLLVGLAVLGRRRGTRGDVLRLLGHWLGPLAGSLLLWQLKPLSHPRYVALFAVALFLLAAYVLDRLAAHRATLPFAALVVLLLLAVSAFSLRAYFFDPRFAKDDTRGTAAALAAHAGPGDLILVPPEDWSLPYYYEGPAQVEMVWPDEAWKRLGGLTRAGQTVYLVDYYRATRDPAGLIPFGLETAGSLADRWGFKGLFVRVYRLDRSVEPPSPEPIGARFGPLQLTGVWIEQNAAADTAVAIALRWRLTEPTDAHLRVGLRLQDDEGWIWSGTDDWLLGIHGSPTDRWAVSQEATTYHLLPLPPGTPPLTYSVTLGVYQVDGETVHPLDLLDEAGNPQGQSLDLGAVALGPPLGLEADPYHVADRVPLRETPVEMSDGLALAGASLDRATVAPGQPLFVTLCWRATASVEAQLTAPLVLKQGSTPLITVTAPPGGRYPPDRWAVGQTVVEHRRLVVPPTATDGPATVVLQVGHRRVELGEVEVSAAERLFEPPPMAYEHHVRFGDVAELLGYDLETTEVVWNEPVVVTLYWRALKEAGRADYTVFAHILAADGHLVGQHDGLPAGGARPTPGWVPGEIIADRHEMTFREPYTGPALIEVGLYDPVTLDRVITEGGETFTLLPETITVR